jgi:glycerol-3-phosphate cytidylyltransferase
MVRISIDQQHFSWMGVYFSDREHCEVHAFGMTWDQRYDKEVTVTFLEYIRENKQFETLNALKTQLLLDQQRCQENSWTVLTFGSFDLLHPWHEAYLRFAKSYGEKLVTIVACDESIQYFKKHAPTFSQAQRIEALEALAFIDEVLPWDPKDFFNQLKDIQPNILVFGYDQDTLGVEKRYEEQGLPLPFLVKAPSHQPQIYKSSLLKNKQEKNL